MATTTPGARILGPDARPLRKVSKADRGPTAGNPLTAYLFLLPYLVLFVTFVLGPALYGLYISLHAWDPKLPLKPFIGLDNYTTLFEPGSVTAGPFWSSMLATAKFTLYSVPLLIVLPLALAVGLVGAFRGRNLLRGIFFAPFVLGVAVSPGCKTSPRSCTRRPTSTARTSGRSSAMSPSRGYAQSSCSSSRSRSSLQPTCSGRPT
jgi:multiple sugar transport system permease protein